MKLFFIDGQKKGESFELSPPGASIGRELDNDIILEGEGESRYHAKLESDGKDWKVKDLGSTNGTKHNGTKLTPNELATLKDGDTILIGRQTMLFAEKLTENIDEILPEKETESKKEDSPAPSIIAIKHPSPNDITIPDIEPVKKIDIDDNSSAPIFSATGENEENGKKNASFSESTDFFGKTKQNLPETKKDGKKKHAGLLFYISVIAVTAILISIFIKIQMDQEKAKESKNSNKKTAKNTSGNNSIKGAPLLIRWEKEETTLSPKSEINIFRYVMEINGRKVTLTIDDVKSKYKENLSTFVSEKDIKELEEKIKKTEFMQAHPRPVGIRSGNKDKIQTLTVAYGKEMNSLRIKNTPPPRSFENTTTFLEDFSTEVLKIPPVSLTPEERRTQGLAAYKKGKEFLDNYRAEDENLRLSIQYFKTAINNLKGFKHLKEYKSAIEKKDEATTKLEKEIKKLRSTAIILYNNNEFVKMKKTLQKIMAIVRPDSKHYKDAKRSLIGLEKKMGKK